jgi:hypothetical protein
MCMMTSTVGKFARRSISVDYPDMILYHRWSSC